MKLQPYKPSEFIVQALFINAYQELERKKGRSGRGPGSGRGEWRAGWAGEVG